MARQHNAHTTVIYTQQRKDAQMTAAVVAERRDEAQRRAVTINVRASVQVRNLIDKAAALLGKNRSEFMLDSARRCAEDVLLDQKLFVLEEDRYNAFLELLNEPPKPVPEIKRLLEKKAPWET